MSTPSSDLALILSQYRVMTYHNLETGQDEGLVFVKKEEDASTGELIRWTGHGATSLTNSGLSATSSTAVSSSTTPRVTLPSSRSSGPSCAETSPSTSQKSYKRPNEDEKRKSNDEDVKPNEERDDNVLTGGEDGKIDKEKIKGLNSGRSKLKLQKKSSIKSSGVTAVVGINQALPSSKSASFLQPTSCSKQTEVVTRSTNDDKASSKSMCNLAVPVISDSTISGSCSSPILKKLSPKSVSKPKSLLREKNLDRLMIAGNSGWVREIIKGDRKSIDSNKIRIAYLPPKSLKCIRNRIYSTRQLTTFLESQCKNTNLTKDNFSFSPRVFGLGLPWEVVRHANIPKKERRSEKRACQPVDNKLMGSQLEGVNYSPMQHAMPLKPKQNMPGRINKLSSTGIVGGKGREKLKPLLQDSKNENVVKDVQASKLKGIEIRNVVDPMKKDIQCVSRVAVAGGDMAQEEVDVKYLQNFTKLNIREVQKTSPVVSLAGPESMDLPDVEIVGCMSRSNNNSTVVSHSKQEGSSSWPIDCDSEDTMARALHYEGVGKNSVMPASSTTSGQQLGSRRDSVIRSTESHTLSLSNLPNCISVTKLSLN